MNATSRQMKMIFSTLGVAPGREPLPAHLLFASGLVCFWPWEVPQVNPRIRVIENIERLV
jgi:hypothetical protein